MPTQSRDDLHRTHTHSDPLTAVAESDDLPRRKPGALGTTARQIQRELSRRLEATDSVHTAKAILTKALRTRKEQP